MALAASPAWAGLSVGRSTFARGVVAREPVGAADQFPGEVDELYFYTQVLGAEGAADIRPINAPKPRGNANSS